MLLLTAAVITVLISASVTADSPGSSAAPLPVVLWHGMGDSCCNPKSMGKIRDVIEKTLPGVYVHSIQIGASADEDSKASFFGNLNDQVAHACHQLATNPRLAGGFNAIGFSQGGQALRAYVQRCNHPPVRNLVTYGSQHAGVADIPNCAEKGDFRCEAMRRLVRKGVYLPMIQRQVVQAQYFKDPSQLDTYLERSEFLADINNERVVKNATYAKHLASLERLIMVRFQNDTMVWPPSSAWFDYVDANGRPLSLKSQPLYAEDWIGLRRLDEKKRLVFTEVPGEHMRISLDHLINEILLKYFVSGPSPVESITFQ
jgi:palmitoyl-protein thioesterase